MKRYSILMVLAMFCGVLALGCGGDSEETTAADDTMMSSGEEMPAEDSLEEGAAEGYDDMGGAAEDTTDSMEEATDGLEEGADGM